ncbi:MAG: protein kinase [Bryobacteraceae bacterium]
MERIGRYEIQGELGAGGFGKVYRAFDPLVRRLVAIKVLTGEMSGNTLDRFRVEAMAAGNLRHKNILTVYDFAEEGGRQYMVMEYLDGDDLQQVLKSGRPLSLLQKMRIMHEVAEGLRCAHANGVVHRDIKPGNIMVLSDGTVKIMDFGIARLTGEEDLRMTKTGFFLGSLLYMSPDQFKTGEIGALCDIWSYGVVYYELLSGANPYRPGPTANEAAVMYKIANWDPPLISESAPGCPQQMDPIIQKLLSREPDGRYQSFEDVQFDVEPLLLEFQKVEAASLYQQARKLDTPENLDRAETLIRQVLDLDPGHTEARHFREHLRKRSRQIRQSRAKVDALLRRSEDSLSRQDFADAIEAFRAVLALDPENTRALLRLPEAQDAHSRRERAQRLVSEARECFRKSELTTAFEKATEALKAEPANPQAKDLVAGIRAQMDQRQRSVAAREGLSKARGLMVTGALDDAVALLKDLSLEHPESAEISELLAATQLHLAERNRKQKIAAQVAGVRDLLRAGRLSAAAGELEELQRTDPDNAEIAEMLAYTRDELERQKKKLDAEQLGRNAWALAKAKKFDEAIAEAERGLEDFPDEDWLHRLRQKIAESRDEEQRDRAVGELLARVEGLEKSANWTEAERAVSAMLDTHPGEARLVAAQNRIARVLDEARHRKQMLANRIAEARDALTRGQAEASVTLLEEILRTDPEGAEAASLLETAREAARQQAREREARNEAQSAIAAAAELERSGDLLSARDRLRHAARQHPGIPEIGGALARLEAAIADMDRHEIEKTVRSVEADIEAADWDSCFRRLGDAESRYSDKPVFAQLRARAEERRRGQEQSRNRERLEQLARDVSASIARRDWQRCERQINDATRVFPGEGLVDQLRENAASARRDLEEKERLQYLAGAAEAIQAGIQQSDWDLCQARLDEAERRYPGSQVLEGLRAKVHSGRQRELAERRREDLGTAVRAIEEAILRRAWPECAAKLKGAEQAFPNETLITGLQARFEFEREQDERRQRRENLAALAKRVEEAMRMRDWPRSLSLIDEATREFPAEPELAELRGRVVHEQQKENEDRRLRETEDLCARISDAIVREDWKAGEEMLQAARKLSPEHGVVRRLETQLREARDRRAALVQAEQQLGRRQEREAAATLKGFLARQPNDPEARALLARIEHQQEHKERQAQYDTGRSRVDQLLRDRQYDKAIKALEQLLAAFPGDPALEANLQSAIAARDLQGRSAQLGEAVAKAERLYRKGRAEEVLKETAAILAVQEEPRARELHKWAEAAIQRQREAAAAPADPAAKPERGSRAWMGIAAAVVLIAGGYGVTKLMTPSAQPPREPASAPARLGRVSPESLSFTQTGAALPPQQTIDLLGDSAAFTVSAVGDWFRVTPDRGTAPATLNVAIAGGERKSGQYSGFINISGEGGPIRVAVNLTVEPPLEATMPPKPQVSVPERKQPERQPPPKQPEAPKPEPPVVTKAPTPPPAEPQQPMPTGPYLGALYGSSTWTGTLAENATLTFGYNNRVLSGGGVLGGKPLPPVECTIAVKTAGIAVVESRAGRLRLKNNSGSPVRRIEFTWRVK